MDELLVCGNLNVDSILSVDYLPEAGQSTPIRSMRKEFGGCGGNISLAAAKLGVPVHLSSVIGRDMDPDYRGKLERMGIDLEHLVVDSELPSPFCIVLSAPDGEQEYAFMEGAMALQKDIPPPFPASGPVGYCHIATSHPDFVIRTARAMSESGISTAFDPGQEIYFRWKGPEIAKALDHCDLFFGNLGEWEYMLDLLELEWEERNVSGIVYPWTDRIFDLLEEAVITLGEKGSMLLRREEIIYLPALEVDEVADATGAGDAFRGGFYAAVLRGFPSDAAIEYGNAMGAISITVPGPQDYDASWEKLLEMVKK